MSIKISQNFDAGAIEVVRAEQADSIELKLRKDSHADIAQWFYFRLQGARGEAAVMHITNAGESTYPKGWENYRAVASYDREEWFRVETEFDGKTMTIRHTPEGDSVYYAYFEPYSWERHLALLGSVEHSALARVVDLGNTVDGRDLNMVVVGDPSAKKKSMDHRAPASGRDHGGVAGRRHAECLAGSCESYRTPHPGQCRAVHCA